TPKTSTEKIPCRRCVLACNSFAFIWNLRSRVAVGSLTMRVRIFHFMLILRESWMGSRQPDLIMWRRSYLAIAIGVTVVAGLASRKYPWLLPASLGKYPGDVLWAQMVYWSIGFVMPSASVARVTTCALAICYADEFSQLYQAPWINNLRSTTVGHLILGSE